MSHNLNLLSPHTPTRQRDTAQTRDSDGSIPSGGTHPREALRVGMSDVCFRCGSGEISDNHCKVSCNNCGQLLRNCNGD